jgi:hypothetical protein
MEELHFHCMDFYEIWYLSIFPKQVEKIQALFKSYKERQSRAGLSINILVPGKSRQVADMASFV